MQEYRCSAADMSTLKGVQDSLNTQYSSSIVTEFAFNGAGILEEVDSPHIPPYEETIVNVKGVKMTPPGRVAFRFCELHLCIAHSRFMRVLVFLS